MCLTNALENLDTAYNNFFDKRGGFPKFKRKYYIHKITKELSDNNDIIVSENLKVKDMISKKKIINKKVKDLSIRKWECECGCIHDRDINSSLNILFKGLESYLKEEYEQA